MTTSQNARLGDIAKVIMGQSPLGNTCNYRGEGTPLLNGPTEFGSRFPTPIQFTSDPKRKASKGDLLFCVRGSTTGRMNWADREYAIGRGLAAIRHIEGIGLNPFLKGVIDNNLKKLLAQATGSTFPNISKDQLDGLKIVLPVLSEQRFTAHVLSSYDNLIENNEKRIKILEEMAQRLYTEWFVKFKFPGHEKVNLIDSETEFGIIPDGWRIKSIESICSTIVRGVTPKYENSSKRYIINQKVNRGNILHIDELKELDLVLVVPKEKLAALGDVLINSLGEGTIGRVHFYTETHNKWAVDQHITICRSDKIDDSLYVYFSLSSIEGQKRLLSLKTGGTNMTMLNISAVRKFEIVVPTEDLLYKFKELVIYLFKQRQYLIEINHNLSKARDLLIPQLVTGKRELK